MSHVYKLVCVSENTIISFDCVHFWPETRILTSYGLVSADINILKEFQI